jgi:hypothetical protein
MHVKVDYLLKIENQNFKPFLNFLMFLHDTVTFADKAACKSCLSFEN